MEFHEEMRGKTVIPVANYLFCISEKGMLTFPLNQASVFYHTTVQMLFVSSRVQHDLQLVL